jgi:hypothetical protein
MKRAAPGLVTMFAALDPIVAPTGMKSVSYSEETGSKHITPNGTISLLEIRMRGVFLRSSVVYPTDKQDLTEYMSYTDLLFCPYGSNL